MKHLMAEYLNDDIVLLFVGAVLSALINSVFFFAILMLIFIKHVIFGKVFSQLASNGIMTLVLFFIAASSYGVASQASLFDTIRDLSFLVCSICIGLSWGSGREAYDFRKTLLKLRNIIVIACFFSVIMELFGHTYFDVINAHTPFQTAIIDYEISRYRFRSFFAHPIVFGHMLLFAFVVTFYLERNTMAKIFYLALLSIFVFMTRSRSAWLIWVILFVAMGGISVHKRGVRHWELVVLALPVVVFGTLCLAKVGIFDSIIARFGDLAIDNSFDQRAGAISYMLHNIVSSPFMFLFGSGDDASGQMMKSTFIAIEGFSVVDNGWLTLLYNQGIVGVISFVALALSPFFRRFEPDDEALRFSLGIGLGLVTMFEMCFYEAQGWYVPFSLFLIFSSAYVSLSKKKTLPITNMNSMAASSELESLSKWS